MPFPSNKHYSSFSKIFGCLTLKMARQCPFSKTSATSSELKRTFRPILQQGIRPSKAILYNVLGRIDSCSPSWRASRSFGRTFICFDISWLLSLDLKSGCLTTINYRYTLPCSGTFRVYSFEFCPLSRRSNRVTDSEYISQRLERREGLLHDIAMPEEFVVWCSNIQPLEIPLIIFRLACVPPVRLLCVFLIMGHCTNRTFPALQKTHRFFR